MDKLVIEADLRERVGKGAARKFRAAQKLPAVIYGAGMETQAVVVDPLRLQEAISGEAGENVLLKIKVAGRKDLASKIFMLKELQSDPISGEYIHADLMEVRMDKPVQIEVPLVFTGKAHGVIEGGILQEMHRSIEVECLPADIPENIEVDITEMEMEQVLHLKDITLPDKVKPLEDPEIPLVHILSPKRLEEELPAAPEGEEAEAEAASEEGEKKEEEEKKSEKPQESKDGDKD